MTGFRCLSGRWLGRYDYPDGMESVGFEVDLSEAGGALTGLVREPNTFRPEMGEELVAQVMGEHAAGQVSFVKYYIGFAQGDDPVYEGRANHALTRVEGHWRFAGQVGWSGRFVMIRKPEAVRAEAAEARQAR